MEDKDHCKCGVPLTAPKRPDWEKEERYADLPLPPDRNNSQDYTFGQKDWQGRELKHRIGGIRCNQRQVHTRVRRESLIEVPWTQDWGDLLSKVCAINPAFRVEICLNDRKNTRKEGRYNSDVPNVGDRISYASDSR